MGNLKKTIAKGIRSVTEFLFGEKEKVEEVKWLQLPITLPPHGVPPIILDKISPLVFPPITFGDPPKFNIPLPEINFPPIILGTPDLRLRERQESEIRDLAYQKWEEAGRPEGDGKEFWIAAEV